MIRRFFPREFRHLASDLSPFASRHLAPAALTNRVFNDLLRDPFFTSPLDSAFTSLGALERPAVDVKETEKQYVIEAEVPGWKREQISLQVIDDNTLVLKGDSAPMQEASPNISAEHTEVQSNEEPKPTYWINERSASSVARSSFQRTFAFPTKIDAEKVQAQLKDGVLSVNVPKDLDAKQHRKIEINLSE
ncbi:HSP20-like chaperone [Cladochytrium replicatum]|nr:HSP20-like chaperone [Cladochytrium replicatum]